jgi:hypothetical protein
MRTKMRIASSIFTAMLFLLTFVVRPGYAHATVSTHRALPHVAAALYNNVTLPRASWWGGTSGCDTNYSGSKQLGTASYRGEIMCGPMPENGASDLPYNLPIGDPKPVQVNDFECTEAAMRFMLIGYGIHPYVANGYNVVDNYVSVVHGALLKKVSNTAGSQNAPSPGDIMSLGTNPGHVVIVKSVSVDINGLGTVTIVDENGIPGPNHTNGTGTATFPVNNWFIDGSSDGGTVTGWLHPNTLVTSDNTSQYTHILSAVTTASTTDVGDVWAVGSLQLSNGVFQTLAEHWNGTSWTANTPAPANPGTGDNILYGVTALSKSNIWAVGYYNDSNGTETLLENYNGTSWTPQTKGAGQLAAITKVSSTEAWAVGTDNSGNPLTLHLVNGTWTVVANGTTGASLSSVSAVSPSNVIAVGSNSSTSQTVALKWSGTSWSATNPAPPNPSASNNRLFGVYALDATHIYAVGDANLSGSTTGIVTMWNGSSWSTPVDAPANTSFQGVQALSSSNIWLVGTSSASTFVEQFNGTSLTQVASQGSGTNDHLNGVTINPKNGNVWAVGYGTPNSFAQTLTNFFN